METSTGVSACDTSLVAAVLGPSVDEAKCAPRSCLDLEHELQVLTLERDELLQELLALRSALVRDQKPRHDAEQMERTPSRGLVVSSSTGAPVCVRALGHVLARLRRVRQRRCATLSAHELTMALVEALRTTSRSQRRKQRDAAVDIVAEVTREWLGWEAAHVRELEHLRQRFTADRELDLARIARLKDELQRVSTPSMRGPIEPSISTAEADLQARVAVNRRVLELQQALVLKDEELRVLTRTVQTLAGTADASQRQLVLRSPSHPPATMAMGIVSNTRSLVAIGDVCDQFASEKERLQLSCRVAEGQRAIERLEQANRAMAARLRTLEGVVAMRQAAKRTTVDTREDWTESVLRTRVRTLELELEALRSHKAPGLYALSEGALFQRVESFLRRLEAHHNAARDAFAQTPTGDSDRDDSFLQRLYDALYVQYEDLVVQLSSLLVPERDRDRDRDCCPLPTLSVASSRRRLHASTQTTTRSQAVEATQTEPFQWEQQPLAALALEPVAKADAQVMTELDEQTASETTQRALEASVARLEALTSQNEQLRRQLARVHTEDEQGKKTKDERLDRQLAIREQENLELVRQLCDLKAKCFELEQRRRAAEETHETQRRRDLETYMAEVATRLSAIEAAKTAALKDRDALRGQLQRQQDAEAERRLALRDSATETELSGPMGCVVSSHSVMETRLVEQNQELEAVRARCDALQRELEDERQRHRLELERRAAETEGERARERSRVDEIDRAWTELQRELEQLVAEHESATQAADARIAFLLQCVEDCGRLVDSDASVSTRDLYDTVVSLSQRVPGVRPARRRTATGTKSTRPPNNNGPSHGRNENSDEDGGVLGRLDASTWRLRASRLEDELSATSWRLETLEDRLRTEQRDTASLKAEVTARLAKENDLLSKQGALKTELAQLRAQHSALASRLQETRRELTRRDEAVQGTDSECVRLRTALQRKSELVARHKTRADDLQLALEAVTQRVTQLERHEKAWVSGQAKHKELHTALQDARQQAAALLEQQRGLVAKCDAQREQLDASQRRVKSLRQETALLREQLKSARETASVTTAAIRATPGSNSGSAGDATAAMREEIKALKRRVLRKQEVIVACKAKLVALEDELASERSRLLSATQTTRQLSAVHREREQSIRQGTRDLKHALDAEVHAKSQQLDGLRASVFDACEVFVRCGVEPDPAADSDASSALTALDDDDAESEELGRDGIWLELREYASLSTADLEGLQMTRDKAKRSKPRPRAPSFRRERGQRVLHELEHALETTPEDCRAEICQVLEFLCGSASITRSARVARGS
ncbi:hypothetical protein ATCC90586_001034 [Pythium insidiosum]|nr:hypothetical protein ATCC90586_001034 [Pythium insidiosum]